MNYKNKSIQEKFENKFNEILNFIIEFNPYQILSYFYSTMKMELFDNESNTKKWEKSILLKKIQVIIMCIDREKYKLKEINDLELKVIEEKMNELSLILDGEIINSRFDSDNSKNEYIMQQDISKETDGNRYEIFQVKHYNDLFTVLNKEFKQVYKLEVKDFTDGIDKLMNLYYFEYQNSLNEIRNWSEDTIEYRTMVNNIFSLELANIKEHTKWTDEILEVLTFKEEYIINFKKSKLIKDFEEILNKFDYTPIIKIENEYYNLSENKLYDNMRKPILNGICTKYTNSESEIIRNKFTQNIEEIVFKYLSNILGTRGIINNYYLKNGNVEENDILFEYDNNIIIVEVKAGSKTPDLAKYNYKSHNLSMETLIKKAENQIIKLEAELNKKDKIKFYDGNNKNKRIQTKEIQIDNTSKIFKIIVDLENISDIQARADKIKILNMNENIIVLCLDDLRLYSDYFYKQPLNFIHYLLKRQKATRSKEIELSDELYHLGMYREYIDYAEYIKNKINSDIEIKDKENLNVYIVAEDYMAELNEYYYGKYFNPNKNTSIKIKQEYRIKELLEVLNDKYIKYSEKLITGILNLADIEHKKISEIIEQALKHIKRTGKQKFGFMVYQKEDENKIQGFFIFPTYSNRSIDNIDYEQQAYANMKVTKCKKIVMAYLYYNGDDKLIDAKINILNDTDVMFDTAYTNQLANMIRRKRNIVEEKMKKIGRNEKCPCGSGKKYKKCCLNKE